MKRTNVISVAAIVALLGSVSAGFAEGEHRHKGGHGHRGGPVMFDFSAVDINDDGKITEAELQAYHVARFAQMDADNSEAVTVEEMAAHREVLKEQRTERKITPDGHERKRHGGKNHGGVEKMFEHLDADKDGELSAQELYGSKTESMFEKLDVDGDGALTKDELKADPAKHERK